MDRYLADSLQKQRLEGYIRASCPRNFCKTMDYFRSRRSP
jgi:phage FluMu protein Com